MSDWSVKPGGRAHIAQFLADDGVEGEVEAGAAIGFGNLRAEQAGGADAFPGLALDDAVMLVRVHARFDDVGEDSADGVAESVMVVGEDGAVGGLDHRAILHNWKFAREVDEVDAVASFRGGSLHHREN